MFHVLLALRFKALICQKCGVMCAFKRCKGIQGCLIRNAQSYSLLDTFRHSGSSYVVKTLTWVALICSFRCLKTSVLLLWKAFLPAVWTQSSVVLVIYKHTELKPWPLWNLLLSCKLIQQHSLKVLLWKLVHEVSFHVVTISATILSTDLMKIQRQSFH